MKQVKAVFGQREHPASVRINAGELKIQIVKDQGPGETHISTEEGFNGVENCGIGERCDRAIFKPAATPRASTVSRRGY